MILWPIIACYVNVILAAPGVKSAVSDRILLPLVSDFSHFIIFWYLTAPSGL